MLIGSDSNRPAALFHIFQIKGGHMNSTTRNPAGGRRFLSRFGIALSFAWLVLLTSSAGRLRAEGTQLDEQVLNKVKHATVHLKVRLANGNEAEGTGWFGAQAGVIITNAHVLDMLDADSRRPRRIEAVIDSGEASSRTLKAKLLAVDRNSDLAALQVEGENLPEPLEVGTAGGLTETQEVFIFGFPFGKQLGKSITVSKSSVSSLRKEKGELKQVQVNGGMHPGNSGGPVTDARGQIVGVAVKIISGTQINMAIPADQVRAFLNGQVIEMTAELAFRDGDQTRIPIRILTVDPLQRIKNMTLEHWMAPLASPKERIRMGGPQRPEPLPGDTAIESAPVEYDGNGVAYLELPVAPLADDKTCYWLRPVFEDGSGKMVWSRALGNLRPNPVVRQETVVKFQPKPGKAPPAELVDNSTFRIRAVGSEAEVTEAMRLKVIMVPNIRESDGGDTTRAQLRYTSFSIGRSMNGQSVKAEAEHRTIGKNFLKTFADIEFDNDGSVLQSQTELKNVAADQQTTVGEISEHLLQALDLMSVSVPNGPLRPMETIRVQRDMLIGLPGKFVPAVANVRYQFFGTRTTRDGRPTANFQITGRVRGRRGDGLSIGGRLSGNADILLETGQVVTGRTDVKVDLDFVAENVPLRLTGTLAIEYRPAPPPKTPEAKEPAKPQAGG
jgi:S1-C subfamily serine protease